MSRQVLLYTDDFPAATEAVERAGGRLLHVFSPRVFVAALPPESDPRALPHVSLIPPADLSETERLLAEGWEGLQQQQASLRFARESGAPEPELRWDTPGFTPPDAHDHPTPPPGAREGVAESTGTPTSLHLTGKVAVGIISVAGSGPGLAFAQDEIQKVVAEVQEGLNFLASAEPLANVTFFYDWRTVTVNAAPGSGDTYELLEAPWRNAALVAMGFAGSVAGSVAYVNSIKQSFGSDWAYVAFFTKYPLKHFAYQTAERLVMSYANDGWGPDRINQVFAHESGHVFGAADEYGGCGCGTSGQFAIPNGNCVNCTATQASCLMNANKLTLCGFSRGQIGWSTWKEIAGALKWVSVGEDGTVWGVDTNDEVYNYVGNAWQKVAGKLKQISAGNASQVWGVNASDDVFRRSGNGWQQVGGKLKNVSVAPDGTVWGCNANDDVFRRSGNGWQQIGGKLRQISTGGANIVWGVNAANNIFRFTGNSWQQIPGALICVSAASDGTVWGVNAANNIFRYKASSNSWQATPGALKEISVGAAKQIWGVNAANQIFQRRILATP